jgi:pre-mRNA-processing factor 6
MENKLTRKRLCINAMKNSNNDPHTIVSVAKIFWKEKKYNKARKWFERAVTLDPDLGDSWIYYYAFEKDA